MTSNDIHSGRTARFRLAAARVSAAAALVWFAATVDVWFTGPHRWKVLGLKIKLDNWADTWWYATAAALLMLALYPAEPPEAAAVRHAAERLGGAAGAGLDSPRRRWAALGVALGAAAGAFFAQEYFYLLPPLAGRLLVVPLAAAVVGLVLAGFAEGVEASGRGLSDWRRGSIRIGVGLLALGGLAQGPLSGWEARGTDPLLRQSIIAAAAALALGWLLLPPWRGAGAAKIKRRAAIGVAVVAVAASLWDWQARAQQQSPAAAPRQRVILITLDTTRADYLSCYGYGRKTSPNLDRLAAGGARFSRAFCQIGATDPSHSSILTGTYPRTHGCRKNHQAVTGNVPSMAQVFFDRGYTTAAIVSREHVLPENLNIPGFTDMEGVRAWMVDTSAREAWRRAANFLLTHRDQDVFLWVHFFDPHGDYRPHPGISDAFYGQDRGPSNGMTDLGPGDHYSPEVVKYTQDLYAGEIFYTDYYLGKLLDLVQNLEPRAQKPPLILITADHGEFLGEYQDRPARIGFGHGPLFNPGIYVPMLLSCPGVIPAGRVIADVAESVDVAPTLLDYALDYRTYPGQGQSLRPAIDGAGHTDQLAFGEGARAANQRQNPIYSVVSGNLKLLVMDPTGGGPVYDLDRDFAEEHDLRASLPDAGGQVLNDYLDWLKRIPLTPVKERKLSADERRTLKALGYIE